jgi:hypothetical protein
MYFEKINNLTSKRHEDEIEKLLSSETFPWYYSSVTSAVPNFDYSKYPNVKENGMLSHLFRNENTVVSNYYFIISPLIVLLEKKFDLELENKILRVKANLLLKDESFPKNFCNMPHQDIYVDEGVEKPNIRSLIYYINDSDGDTVFFNEREMLSKTLSINRKETPRKGNSVFFDSLHLHASTPPRKTNTRLIINFLFKF